MDQIGIVQEIPVIVEQTVSVLEIENEQIQISEQQVTNIHDVLVSPSDQQQQVVSDIQNFNNAVDQQIMELLKPYYDNIIQLEEKERAKQAQITTLKLALDNLKQKYEESIKIQNLLKKGQLK